MYVLGIDPGITGGIALVDHNKERVLAMDVPTFLIDIKGKKRRNAIDIDALVEMLRDFQGCIDLVVMEEVHPMPTNGSIACFRLGETFGVLQGVLAAHKMPVHLVSPQKWKKHFDLLKKDKYSSLTMARYMFGDEFLMRKKDHNRAEALLIAQWGIETIKGA